MAATFNCPSCGRTIAADVPGGTQVQCPLCNQMVTVPGGADAGLLPSMPVSYASHSGQPTTQGLAIGALVCGIIGMLGCPPVGIVGLVLGIVAVVKASQTPERYGGKGLAIGGICTGAVSILVVPVLLSMILLPLLSRTRELSKRTVCAASMRGIGQAMYIYAEDGGMFPEKGADWQGRLLAAGSTAPGQFLCPSDTLVSGSSFYYVPGYGVESDPKQVIMYEDPAIHGGEGGNILTQDGHVGFVRSPRYGEMIDSITLPDGTPWTPHKDP